MYDGWQCVEERELDGGTWVMRRQYVYGGQYIDEPVLFDNDTDGDEDIDVSYWYLHDTNYNVVALADNAGSTVERCWYEPYGPTTFTNASGTANTPATESDYANTLAFQGQRLDTDSGLYYFRNRHYSPTLGRFAQRDPMGYADGMGLYEFVNGRPIRMLDPHGLFCEDKCSPEGAKQNPKLVGLRQSGLININSGDRGVDLLDAIKTVGVLQDLLNIAAAATNAAKITTSILEEVVAQKAGDIDPDTDAAKKALGNLKDAIEGSQARAGAKFIWIKLQWEECEKECCLMLWRRLNWRQKGNQRWCLCTTFPQNELFPAKGATGKMSMEHFVEVLNACIQQVYSGACDIPAMGDR